MENLSVTTNSGQYTLTNYPNKCPFCHNTIIPKTLFGYRKIDKLEVIFICPSTSCDEVFIGYYSISGNSPTYSGNTSIGKPVNKSFNETISNVSPSFVEIYNQAYFSEQNKLLEICGIGYRKALEFLIKDYLIKNKPADKEDIEKILLGRCIEKYVEDTRIKSVAKRAVWLGNDETHYIRKWENKNLQDLKKLIDLTVLWIESELLTKSFEKEMPENK
jgi:hypothetical protein